LKYKDNAEVLAMVQGERTKGIKILNTDLTKARQKLNAGFGVTDEVVSWHQIKILPINFSGEKTKNTKGTKIKTKGK